jgi:UDP:flavonoid glycosyltransferase YjiC (YdhE family)
MIRVLCCWELGGGFGHLFRLLPIGLELAKRGCQVIYAIRGSARAEPYLRDHAWQIVPAPVWQVPHKAHPLSQTYAQNLLRNGYWHRDSLLNQLKGWLALLETWQPDVVLAEHAPSALLAARKANLPRAAIGTGFSLPPLNVPMPGLQPWFTLPEQYLTKGEAKFLDCVNPVLRDLGATPLDAVADIFQGTVRFLCTFPELDHYGARADTYYWGPVTYTPQDLEAPWLSNRRDNIFLYLNPEHRFFPPIIGLLKEMQLPTVAFAPGLDETDRQSLETQTLSITLRPANLKTAATHCRLMIGHGGHNAGALMLLAGVPLFMCPSQLEQAVWAYRICAQNLGAMINYFHPNPDIKSNLASALTFPPERIGDFAKKYVHFDSSRVAQDVAEKCLTLVRKHPGSD